MQIFTEVSNHNVNLEKLFSFWLNAQVLFSSVVLCIDHLLLWLKAFTL